LQGIWTNPTITPFERPRQFQGKPVLSELEAAALEEQAAESRVEQPGRPGDIGSYNQFWFDSGTKVVGTRQTSLVVDPPDGRVPVKPEAEKVRDDNLARGADSQILQSPGYVTIVYEMIHDVRIIPLDGRPHVGSNVRLWMGDSRGRWEGNTLVVDTTNFTSKGWIASHGAAGRIKGIPQSEALHVVERFTPVDPNTISYEVLIEDSNVYTRPWKVAFPLNRDQDYQIYEYACHEGNRAVANILSGGRAQEAAGTGGQKESGKE
jgi:hypothetical protein